VIISDLGVNFPDPDKRSAVKVLVPGAGLGRLAYEINAAGFTSQGNEFSLPMIFASMHILNGNHVKESITIYPFALPWSNVVNADHDQFVAVQVPDVQITAPPPGTDFSMTAGDFEEVYSTDDQHSSWDAIVTSYFLDTAKNVINYIEIIRNLLKPGGLWINNGPLLYHFEGHPGEPSIELSANEIRMVMEKTGFIIEKESFTSSSSYCQNPWSMHQTIYKEWYFIARLPLHSSQ
jgi:carnosine N-methyltransferase